MGITYPLRVRFVVLGIELRALFMLAKHLITEPLDTVFHWLKTAFPLFPFIVLYLNLCYSFSEYAVFIRIGLTYIVCYLF